MPAMPIFTMTSNFSFKQEIVPSDAQELFDNCREPSDFSELPEGSLSHESLPNCEQKNFDSGLVKAIVASVVEHYKVRVAFLALEAVKEMRLKARCGVECKTAKRDSIAHHSINRPLPIIIEDAHAHKRFQNDPFVARDPFIRFSVAAPLMLTPGRCVGSLCIMDREPRHGVTLQDCEMLCLAATRIMDVYRAAEIADVSAVTMGSLPTMGNLPAWQPSTILELEPDFDDRVAC